MTGFVAGITAPWRGFLTIARDPKLWPFVVAPAAITATLLVAALLTALFGAAPLTRWLLPGLHDDPWLRALAMGLIWMLLSGAFGLTAWMSASLLCIPVNDRLSEMIESKRGELPPALSWKQALPMSIRHSLAGFGLWLGIEACMLPLELVPGVGSAIHFVLGFLVSAFFVAHQLVDGALSRRAMRFRDKLRWLWLRPGPVFGLGIAGMALLAFPIVNLFGMPIAVAGGALLFTEVDDLPGTPRAGG
jgi:CysZ protein